MGLLSKNFTSGVQSSQWYRTWFYSKKVDMNVHKPFFPQETKLLWTWPQSALYCNFLLQIADRGEPPKSVKHQYRLYYEKDFNNISQVDLDWAQVVPFSHFAKHHFLFTKKVRIFVFLLFFQQLQPSYISVFNRLSSSPQWRTGLIHCQTNFLSSMSLVRDPLRPLYKE